MTVIHKICYKFEVRSNFSRKEFSVIFLSSIYLSNFKGIKELTCDFEDFTLLTGLNNSGKTTVLQAVRLITAALPQIAIHTDIFSAHQESRAFNIEEALTSLGFNTGVKFFPEMNPVTKTTIKGTFQNGLVIEIVPTQASHFYFTVSSLHEKDNEEVKLLLSNTTLCPAEFVTPPGTVSSIEDMLSYREFQRLVSQGKGSQFWRNSIWWSLQKEGFESFEDVRSLVGRYFPGTEVMQPTLGTSSSTEIIFHYKELGGAKLDFAQSGAGLRTFLTLARLLGQSSAKVLLLDEPDAHLHSSQQTTVINLLMDAAIDQGKQVIVASHSPDFIVRTPDECIRWIEPGKPNAQSDELQMMLGRLGVTPGIHTSGSLLPEIIVYVEGKTDKPVIESLVAWCRGRFPELPNVTIAIHDGRFEVPSLQSIRRVIEGIHGTTRIIGIRDLDYYYFELPVPKPEVKNGAGWVLLTLPCKELENLYCDPQFLFSAFERVVPIADLSRIINEESQNEELIRDWGNQIKPKIRERLPNTDDAATKEDKANRLFGEWRNDSDVRRRLVPGKRLFAKVRGRLKQEFGVNRYPQRIFEPLTDLTPEWAAIASTIFPGFDFFKPSGTTQKTATQAHEPTE